LETGFVKVADRNEIQSGKTKKVKLGKKEILIVNIGERFYAIQAHCTHRNGDLSMSSLDGTIVTCPVHGAKFDVTTGRVVSPPKMGSSQTKIEDEPTYPVKVENEDVLVKLVKNNPEE
jgi:nitrite reductase/ring-hydroxylating ferredoxin subunit